MCHFLADITTVITATFGAAIIGFTMNKNSLVITCMSVIIIFLLISITQYKNNNDYKPNNSKASTPEYSVAIITPTTHPSLEKIEEGFKTTLEQSCDSKIRFTTYNAHGKKTLMNSQVSQAINSSCSLIFTIGTGATIMAKEKAEKSNTLTPIVFGAVSRPGEHKIYQNDKCRITGTVETYIPKLQAQALKYLKPTAKNLLIAYDPSQRPQMEEDATRAQKIFERHGMSVKKVEVFNVGEMVRKVSPILDNIDCLLVLIDNTTVSGIDGLIKLCNRKNITLISSDLDSGIKGAALSVGVNERDYGVNAGHLATQILCKKINPNNLEFIPVADKKIQINTSTMEKQNLNIDKNLLLMIKQGQTHV